MILTALGLAASAAFAGAALHVSWSEQPARLSLDDEAMLQEWRPSYRKAYQMQATLALAAGVIGIAAWLTERAPAAAIGGIFMLLNWPFTLIVMAPTNRRLGATPAGSAGPETRAMMVNWGRLHAVRTGLGVAAAAAFWAALSR